jgi:starch phosphorylase
MKDFDSYVEAQKTVNDLYKDTENWSRMSAMNIAHSGIFASDETIKRYAEEIWNV